MAECHPVGFQWVMEAKARGATVIHVDPRFTRTSAVADLHVPLRAGSDIVFLGAIINYVLGCEKYFRDYVVSCTNAAAILTEDFAGPEDLDGVFSGLNREHRTYDFGTWRYQGGDVSAAAGRRDRVDRGDPRGAGGAAAHPAPDTDETLQHPRWVFQVLKRHFARYTPEMVEQVCGVPPETFARVCELVTDSARRAAWRVDRAWKRPNGRSDGRARSAVAGAMRLRESRRDRAGSSAFAPAAHGGLPPERYPGHRPSPVAAVTPADRAHAGNGPPRGAPVFSRGRSPSRALAALASSTALCAALDCDLPRFTLAPIGWMARTGRNTVQQRTGPGLAQALKRAASSDPPVASPGL